MSYYFLDNVLCTKVFNFYSPVNLLFLLLLVLLVSYLKKTIAKTKMMKVLLLCFFLVFALTFMSLIHFEPAVVN